MDLIVWVPERDVVFTGDLLFNGAYPVSLDADMIAWRSCSTASPATIGARASFRDTARLRAQDGSGSVRSIRPSARPCRKNGAGGRLGRRSRAPLSPVRA